MPTPITVIVVPVDGPARVERIEAAAFTSQLQALLDDWPEYTRYDLGVTFVVGDAGRLKGLPLNKAATEYVLRDSLMARRIAGTGAGWPEGYGLYGTVVVVGNDMVGEPMLDAPERFHAIFGTEPTPTDRDPYVGQGAEGCLASAEIDREEAATFDADDPRREARVVSAWRWQHQAARLQEGARP